MLKTSLSFRFAASCLPIVPYSDIYNVTHNLVNSASQYNINIPYK